MATEKELSASQLYISFNDDASDPTYTSAAYATLVASPPGDMDDNPCVEGVVLSAPVLPCNRKELEAFAQILGWDLRVEDGLFVLRTNIRE